MGEVVGPVTQTTRVPALCVPSVPNRVSYQQLQSVLLSASRASTSKTVSVKVTDHDQLQLFI